jgi:hypothetical protein
MAQRMKETGQTNHPKYQKILKVIAQQQTLRTKMKQPLAQPVQAPIAPYQPPVSAPAPATTQRAFTNEQLKTLQEQIQSYKHLRQSLDDIAEQINRQRSNDARVIAEQRRKVEMQNTLPAGYPSKGSTVSTWMLLDCVFSQSTFTTLPLLTHVFALFCVSPSTTVIPFQNQFQKCYGIVLRRHSQPSHSGKEQRRGWCTWARQSMMAIAALFPPKGLAPPIDWSTPPLRQ